MSSNVNKTLFTYKLCQQKYSQKTGITTIKEHFKTNHNEAKSKDSQWIPLVHMVRDYLVVCTK
jgi:hypothetical protein